MIPHISFSELAQVAMVFLVIGFVLGAAQMHWLHKKFTKKEKHDDHCQSH